MRNPKTKTFTTHNRKELFPFNVAIPKPSTLPLTVSPVLQNSLMPLRDKILLRKRPLIETVNDELKNIVQIEHTRHRSIGGFAANLMAAMAAYSFLPQKPSLNIEIIERERRIA